ncbi:hypothetical protein PLICRDRAFT_173931 [Plicaturopsis crispa FD-325 SS-3]|nr:hypothetical protein PLICRDRAFT_173931 [Plicaturopsis crispa FD-325 SS-3]
MALKLGQVCRRWRAVALSTPRLWSTIHLSTNRKYLPAEPQRLLEVWLERSQPLPLSLSLKLGDHFGPTAGDGRRDAARSWVDLLTAHSERWEILKFVKDVPCLDKIRAISDQLPRLHTVELLDFETVDDTDIADVSAILRSAPQLRHMEVDHKYLTTTANLPWTQLTYISVDRFNSNDMPFILQHLPNLRKVFLYGGDPHLVPAERRVKVWSGRAAMTPISHTQLVDFGVSGFLMSETFPVFDCMTLPNLKVLYVGPPPHGFKRETAAMDTLMLSVLSFLRRSRCPVESLRLKVPEVEDTTHIVKCIHEIGPSLIHLDLMCINALRADILSCLTWYPSSLSVDLAPNLRSLEMHSLEGAPGVVAALVRMLRSRLRISHGHPDVCLTNVVIRIVNENLPDDASVQELRKIRRQGLYVALFCKNTDVLAPS